MTSQKQGLILHAKGFLNDRLEDLKIAFGKNEHPQAKIEHEQEYLNDIARGYWKLNHCTKTTIKYRPVVNVPVDYMMGSVMLRKFDRNPLLEQIRKGHKLHHVKTNDRSGLIIEKGWKSRKAVDRKKLLSEINEFFLSKLRSVQDRNSKTTRQGGLIKRAKGFLADKLEDIKYILGFYDYPQKNIQHEQNYLNDIAKGNWKLKRWSQTSIRYRPVVNVPVDYMMDSVKLRKFDRNPLFEQIRKGRKLRHVETNDRTRFLIEKGWKSRKAVDHKKFLSELTRFFTMRRLRHVQTADKGTVTHTTTNVGPAVKKELMAEIRQVRSAVKSGSS